MRRGMPAIWGLVKPLVIYYIGYYVLRMVVGTLLAGSGMDFLLVDGASIVNGIAMLGGLAFLFPMIEEEREEERLEKAQREARKEESIEKRTSKMWSFAIFCWLYLRWLR